MRRDVAKANMQSLLGKTRAVRPNAVVQLLLGETLDLAKALIQSLLGKALELTKAIMQSLLGPSRGAANPPVPLQSAMQPQLPGLTKPTLAQFATSLAAPLGFRLCFTTHALVK
jgi:hypothetical protein